MHLIKSIILLLFFCFNLCQAQKSDIQYCENNKFNAVVSDYIDFVVPVISVAEFSPVQKEYLILDAREKEEYDISHIPDAKFIGYENPDYSILKNIPSETPIVLNIKPIKSLFSVPFLTNLAKLAQ